MRSIIPSNLILTFCMSAALAACNGTGASGVTPASDGSLVSEDGLILTPIAEGLEFPWGLAELPDGDVLVTEREGRLRMISDGVLVDAPITGLPTDILAEGQGGLLGLALDPDFAQNRRVYLAYSKDMGETNTTAVVKAELSEDGRSLSAVTEIFSAAPRQTSYHFGARLVFMPDGSLMISLGDGYRYMQEAQNPANLHGKIVRIWPDGSLPADNPDVSEDAHPALWSYGHRNVQGLVYHAASATLFAHEHGPKGGDEINVIAPGLNYGWPTITYGINYDGTIITEKTEAPGMQQPVVKWVPSIAPSGMDVVRTAGFPEWQGDLLIGAMNGPSGQKLVRVDLDDSGAVLGTEDLLADLRLPYRDVLSTPSAIYLATADLDGVVYRLDKLP